MIRVYDMSTGTLLDQQQSEPCINTSQFEGAMEQTFPQLQLQEIPLKSRKESVQMPHDLATKSIDNFIVEQQ